MNSKKKNIIECLFASNGKKYRGVELTCRNSGSAALDMAYVACGRFDGYWQRELNYWDIAAGIVILKEAGGFVDFFDEDKNTPLKKNIIASNSLIHDELRELIYK